MRKTVPGIARSRVQSDWKMRNHPWLDTNTLKPKYSVQVREPEIKTWAHVYNGDTNEAYFFDSPEEAAAFIKELQGADHAE